MGDMNDGRDPTLPLIALVVGYGLVVVAMRRLLDALYDPITEAEQIAADNGTEAPS